MNTNLLKEFDQKIRTYYKILAEIYAVGYNVYIEYSFRETKCYYLPIILGNFSTGKIVISPLNISQLSKTLGLSHWLTLNWIALHEIGHQQRETPKFFRLCKKYEEELEAWKFVEKKVASVNKQSFFLLRDYCLNTYMQNFFKMENKTIKT